MLHGSCEPLRSRVLQLHRAKTLGGEGDADLAVRRREPRRRELLKEASVDESARPAPNGSPNVVFGARVCHTRAG